MRTLKGFLYLVLGGTLVRLDVQPHRRLVHRQPAHRRLQPHRRRVGRDPAGPALPRLPHDAVLLPSLRRIALVTMTKYDWTGEREEQKKLRGEEYGNQRWARDDEMQQFAHTSTVKRVPIRIPQRTRDALRFARNNPKDFVKAKLGMTNKVANPKPDYVEKIEDDNIILSERAELQMSKIPDRRSSATSTSTCSAAPARARPSTSSAPTCSSSTARS